MDTNQLAEKVNELTNLETCYLDDYPQSFRDIMYIYTILDDYLDQLFYKDDNYMLGKLLNRFDDALERWEEREKEEWNKEMVIAWEKHHIINFDIDVFSFGFLIEKFSEIKVRYIQNLKSKIESYKIESYKIDTHRTTSETKEAKFTLHPKQNKKTDLIRILNALWGLGIIYKSDLNKPTKEEFMREMGNVFGVDLTNSHKDLSQAFNDCSLETNLKVFETMLKFTKEEWQTRINKKSI